MTSSWIKIPDRELDFQTHVGMLRTMGLLTGEVESDAKAISEAFYAYLQIVNGAIIELHLRAVVLGDQLVESDTKYQLLTGVGLRTKFVWLALRNLVQIIVPGRTEPLTTEAAEEIALNLNTIYINLRGVFDNLAWCLCETIGGDHFKGLRKVHVDLFGNKFRDHPRLTVFKQFSKLHETWYGELKDRRDPAAHRIPLSVPPAVHDTASLKMHRELGAEFQTEFQAAIDRSLLGNHDEENFQKSDELMEKMQKLGTFLPVFLHDPRGPQYQIYPTVTQDVGNMIIVSREVFRLYLDQLLPGGKPVEC